MTESPAPLPTMTLSYLRTLPGGSLTRAEVNILIDYIAQLEHLLGVGISESDPLDE